MLLQPIIHEVKQSNPYAIGLLNFSSKRGQNVGLTISCNEINEEYLINFILTISNKYFEMHPCKKRVASTNTLFKNFPYNSFYFNVSNFPFKHILEYSGPNLSEFLTSIIIDELARERIKDESIFTYYFYVQAIFLKSFVDNYSDGAVPRKLFLDKLAQVTKNSNLLPEKFIQENENYLREIVKNILISKHSFADESRWMKDWYSLSYSVFVSEKNRYLSFEEGYIRYLNLSMFIIEQFGINENLGQSIFTLINRACI